MSEKIEHLQFDLDLKGKQLETYTELYNGEQERNRYLQNELGKCERNLKKTNKALEDLQENHQRTILSLKEKEFIITNLYCVLLYSGSDGDQYESNLHKKSCVRFIKWEVFLHITLVELGLRTCGFSAQLKLNLLNEQVDHPTGTTPTKQEIRLPSLESIEQMRTPSFNDLVMMMHSAMSSEGENKELKQQQQQQEACLSHRSPLVAIN